MIFTDSHEGRSKARVQSAKMPTSKTGRPLSGYSSRNYQKTQLLQGAYVNKQSSPNGRRRLSRHIGNQGVMLEQVTKGQPRKISMTTKPKEELFQENMKLKKQVNRLSEELSILKGQMQARGRRNSQRSKQLDVQFEKPLYWGGNNSHLISGIKHQYERLKKQHQKKQKQNVGLKVALRESRLPEIQVYAEEVAKQNQRLLQKLQRCQNASLSIENRSDREVTKYILQQAQQQNKRLLANNEQLSQKVKQIKNQMAENEIKIKFLEKLVLQKDNKEYHAGLKVKKTCKQKESVEKKYQMLREQHQQLRKINEQKYQQTNSYWERKLEDLEKRYKRQIEIKQKKIRCLEEEQKKTEQAFNRMKQSISGGISHNTNSPIKNRPNSGVKGGSMVQKPSVEPVFIRKISSEPEDEPEKQIQQPKERSMKRANKKHSQNSKKCRKVQIQQIQQIGELIKLRAIAAKVSLLTLKQLFTRKKGMQGYSFQNKLRQEENEDTFILPEETYKQKLQSKEQEWDEEYINMGETIKILVKNPINLKQEQAYLLARYMIEDCDDEYIFSDLENENKREVVKSIIKAIVGEYEVSDEKVLAECEDFILKYGSNVGSVLRTYYPKGIVTKKRLLDIIGGIGANISDSAKNQLSARLAAVSQNLQSLEYEKVFPNEE